MLLTAGGLVSVRWLGRSAHEPLGDVLAAARPLGLVAALALALVEFGLGGARVWVLAHHFERGFRWRDGVRTYLYNAFAAGVTPAQTGGGPAQYFVLRDCGLSGAPAMAVLATNWLGILSGFFVLGSLGFVYLVIAEGFGMAGLLKGLFIAALAIALAAFVATVFPAQLRALLMRFSWPRRSNTGRRFLRALARYSRAVKSFARGGKGAWAANLGLSWLHLLTKCLIGVAALWAIGVEGKALSAIARLALQYAVIYVSPTPGGSGVAEASAAGFMGGLIPEGMLLWYTLLWRSFSGYLPIVIGGVFAAVDLARRTANAGAEEEG